MTRKKTHCYTAREAAKTEVQMYNDLSKSLLNH